MQNVEPCNSNNAIKVVAFAIDFAHEVGEQYIKDAINLYNQDADLNKELPHVQPQESIHIDITNGIQAQKQTLGAVVFENFSELNEPIWSIIIRRNGIAVTCRSYSRWDTIWPQAKEYLSKMLTLFVDKVQIGSITLEYVDEFLIQDISSDWKKDLFNNTTRFLTTNVFDVEDFWHSYHGYFSKSTNDHIVKVLNTINIEYIEEEPKSLHKIIIRTQHRSLTENIIIDAQFLDTIFSKAIDDSHQANKEIFVNLLSADMQKRITLKI